MSLPDRGGTIIWMHPGFEYPRLIPVEYTPLYTGVRQQFGNLGGTYVMPWAYDREHVVASGDRLLVDKADVRMFTLADVIGSSGAAPQLQLMLGTGGAGEGAWRAAESCRRRSLVQSYRDPRWPARDSVR